MLASKTVCVFNRLGYITEYMISEDTFKSHKNIRWSRHIKQH